MLTLRLRAAHQNDASAMASRALVANTAKRAQQLERQRAESKYVPRRLGLREPLRVLHAIFDAAGACSKVGTSGGLAAGAR